MKQAIHIAMLAILLSAASAGAQAPQPETAPALMAVPARPDPYDQRTLRRPPRDASSGPVLLRYQAMQKLKKRFEDADVDHSGSLTRDEARKAGLGFVDKNFDHIDSTQRGAVSFDDINAYLLQRREEARSR
jgi:hypothetical protein